MDIQDSDKISEPIRQVVCQWVISSIGQSVSEPVNQLIFLGLDLKAILADEEKLPSVGLSSSSPLDERETLESKSRLINLP